MLPQPLPGSASTRLRCSNLRDHGSTSSVRRPVTPQDVIMLTRSRVSETVIANQIQMNGVVSSPSIDDVLAMHDAGVSDFIINEMQHARLVGATPW